MVSTEVEEYRPRFGRALTVVIGVLGAGAVVAGLVSDAAAMWRYVAPIAFVVLWTWAAFWRPAVIVSPAGVEIRNVSRTIELPWPTIESIETKFALTLNTAHGVYAAWAAPAPSRNRAIRRDPAETKDLPPDTYVGGTIGPGDLAGTPSGEAAAMVRARWAEVRDAGLLNDPKVERQRPRVQWHTYTLVALGVLLAASVAGLVV